MFQALKLGFRNLSFVRFSAVDYWSPKFNGVLSVNLRMSSKRVRSKSSNVDLSKNRKNAAKASSGDECEDVETMTLQQMKSKMRSSDVPARGANHTIVSPLKSKVDGERSSVDQDQAVSEEKPTVAKTVPKRKAKGISDSDKVGAERAERRVKQSSVHATEVNTLESTSEQELIIKSIDMEGETSIRVKRKVSSKTTTLKVDLPVEEPWTVLTHKKPQKSWTAYNPKTMRPPPIDASTAHVKLMSWNVNGLRALLKLESFSALQLAQRENFDVLCLQETKLQDKDVDAIRQTLIEGYDNSYWTCSVAKLGYSGTAIISRIKPVSVRYGLGISDHDSEGRLVTVEFDNFFLLCGYVPNSGDGLRRLSYRINEWDPSLSNYMKDLERTKPVILTGDLNCCHQEIDIWNPAGNKRSAGFTDEERQSFQTNFLDRGFVDTFRKQHPDAVGYTYWGYRHGGRKNNKGWRLDYFLASESIADQVHDSFILPDVGGSDHSPIGLVLKLQADGNWDCSNSTGVPESVSHYGC